MAVAVNRDAVGLAVPRADWRLEVIRIILNIDLLLDPIWHDRGKALAADIAFEWCAHFKNVEIDGLGGNRLLEASVVIGLCKIDPVDLSACIGFPRLQEAAEQHVVQVLVVQAHEVELDALEFTRLHIGLGGFQAHFAHLLPFSIARRTFADPWNFEDRCAKAIRCKC